MTEPKTLEELINTEDLGWSVVQEWMAEAKNSVEVLPATKEDKEQTLLETQVTTKSILGSIIYESGGLLIDSGWIRILGSGCDRLPRSVSKWNMQVQGANVQLPYHLVADDITGGFFASDAGGLGNPGKMFYFAPDTLQWEDLDTTYPEFIYWCMTADLESFYEGLRWQGWQAEVSELPGDQAMLYLPLLFTKPVVKAQQKLERERKPVPLVELYEMYVQEFAKQIANMKDGQIIKLQVE